MGRILFKEPLFHFLLLGGGLFLLFGWLDEEEAREAPGPDPGIASPSREIVISRGKQQSLQEQFGKVWQRPPREEEMKGLIEQSIREEVMYREALALNLDKDDSIVRRRLQQKLEFVTEDIAMLAPPSDQELQTYLESRAEVYRFDTVLSFKQVYLNREKRGERLSDDTETLLAELRAKGAAADIAELGDGLMLEQVFEGVSQRDVERMFGGEFAAALVGLPVGAWQGPVTSGFGIHLVYLGEKEEGRLPELPEVRDAVERDWLSEKRRESNEAIYQKWRKGYTVTIEDVPSAADADEIELPTIEE